MNEPTYHLPQIVKNKNEQADDFNGPLDLILLLLSKNKIAIRDIQIAEILKQYLDYLDRMKQMDLEIASEFITMASQLMLIKTKMLLSEAERQEGLSEMEQLIASLEQRQRQEIMEKLRTPAAFLENRNDLGRGIFTKDPEPLRRDGSYRYQHRPEDLVRAMENIRESRKEPLPTRITAFDGIVGREPYPVEKKATEIIRLLAGGARRLKSLFALNRSRSEVVATFLSVLELCRMRSVRVTDAPGADYDIEYVPGNEEEESADGNG